MKNQLLFLLLFPLATMVLSFRTYAADPPESEYEAAMAAITDGYYYITTKVDGVKYYVTIYGGLTDYKEEGARLYISKIDASSAKDKLYDVAILIEGANGHFSNTTLIDEKANLHPGTGVFRLDPNNNRNDFERQIFYLNNSGKFAIRSCNTIYAESGWKDAGRAFWTYEIDEAGDVVYSDYGPMPAYSYTPDYVWMLERPADDVQAMDIMESLVGDEGTYKVYLYDDRENPHTLNMGTGFGQYSDWESWYAFYDLLQVVNAAYWHYSPSLADAESWKARLDELYQKILDSTVPYTVPDGYYRIIAHNRYKSAYDVSGFVDKAIATSFDFEHENKAVYGTLKRDRADYLWKLTKSESGDSILIQNAGSETYISFSSINIPSGVDEPETRVFLTNDINDASHVVFDYAGQKYVEYADANGDIIGDNKDIFCIRLASSPRDPYGRYIHQRNHGYVEDPNAPYDVKYYSVDKGIDQELCLWQRTWDTGRTNDKWTSEWYLEFVPNDIAQQIIADFSFTKEHELLVAQNKKLRAQVLETLTIAKDAIKTPIITSASQLSSPYSDSVEGQNIEYLIDNDASTFWHTDYHDQSPEGMFYNNIECHYLQISGMENMVGDSELYFRERDADNDRPSKIVLMGTDNMKNDDDGWEEIAVLTLPHTGKGEENTVPLVVEDSYPYVRILVYDTEGSDHAFRTFWHAAEIQFYTVEENPNSQFAALGEIAKMLEETYKANVATPDEDITIEMYQALLDAYDIFLGNKIPYFDLTYIVDGEVYKTYEVEYGTGITPETEPTKEGYTFGGWNDLPETMPAHDVVVTGAFYLYGDVNTDSEVDVVDVVDIARFVVGTPASTFMEVLADINRDGAVNIGDAVVLVNDITGNQNFVKAWDAPQGYTAFDILSLTDKGNCLLLSLENERNYTAFQFDLYVPENIDVTQMMLNAERKQGHQLLYNKVENGHYRVAALSTSNQSFDGDYGELLNIALDGVSGNEVSLRNIHFFDAEGCNYLFDDIYGSSPTSIRQMDNGQLTIDNEIYDLQGRKRTALQRGINIVGGKMIIY